MGTMSFMRASGYVVFEREATDLAVIAMTAGPPDAQTRAHYHEVNQAAAQATRIKAVLTCGEVWGVALVEDQMAVSAPSAAIERWHRVAHHAMQA